MVLPTIQVMPDTQTACAPDEQCCELDDVCYPLSRVRYDCERRGGPACACVDESNQPLPENAECQYAISFE